MLVLAFFLPSTLAQYLFLVFWVANQKRESEFKMVVKVGLQDNSSMNITLETSYDFILYVFYSRIKLKYFASVIIDGSHFYGRQVTEQLITHSANY